MRRIIGHKSFGYFIANNQRLRRDSWPMTMLPITNISMPRKKKIIKKIIRKCARAKAESKEELLLQPPRGMRDILPADQIYWQQVRRVSEKAAADFGYRRIDIPLVEFTNIFSRSIGEGTDIVEKEMYSFSTKGGEKVISASGIHGWNCPGLHPARDACFAKTREIILYPVLAIAMTVRRKGDFGNFSSLAAKLWENRIRFWMLK